jgi:hypothetical protein
MQSDRSAGSAAVTGSVRGLGVCDVLQVELSDVQRPGLARALEARLAEVAQGAPEDAPGRGDERRLLARLRAQLPEDASDAFTLVGPAGLVLGLVHRCLVDAVAALCRALPESGPPSLAAEPAHAAAVAAAWIATALDCRAVERYCFDSEHDAVHAW